jgi:transcriptional regulator with XRE-family HTH domain
MNSKAKSRSEVAFRGNRLRALRHERELSADKLARLTGLTTHHIYRLERGERPNVWGTTVAKLAVALDTTTDYLLNLTEESKPPKHLYYT